MGRRERNPEMRETIGVIVRIHRESSR